MYWLWRKGYKRKGLFKTKQKKTLKLTSVSDWNVSQKKVY